MSWLSRLAKLDSTLQHGLDNGFAAVFGGKVVPAELEALLKELVADNIVRTFDGKVEAPNLYTIFLSQKDADHLAATHPELPESLASQLTRYLRNQHYHLGQPVQVQLYVRPGQRTGQLAGEATFGAASPQPPTPPASKGEQMNQPQPEAQTELLTAQPAPPQVVHHAPTVTLLLQDGSSRTYLVQEGSNIIGRGQDVDFRLPDTGVSRRHAEITWDGQDAVLVDLKSTNGTTVNDVAIDNWLLADGDVITMGHSYIEVRITPGS